MVNTLAVGELLNDIIRTGRVFPDVQAAYATAYPELAMEKSFVEAAADFTEKSLPVSSRE